MRVSTLPLISSLGLLAACSTTATMIPVEGPLSELRPVPVLQVHVGGILGNSGDLSFVMPDGDRCDGRWASAAGAGVTYTTGSLLTEYGAIHLSGYSVSADGGQNPGQALAVCGSGRTYIYWSG